MHGIWTVGVMPFPSTNPLYKTFKETHLYTEGADWIFSINEFYDLWSFITLHNSLHHRAATVP